MKNTCGRTGREKEKPEYRMKIYGQKTFQGASRDGDRACFSIG